MNLRCSVYRLAELCKSWPYLALCLMAMYRKLRRSTKTGIVIFAVLTTAFSLLVTSVVLLYVALNSSHGTNYLARITDCDKLNPYEDRINIRPKTPCDRMKRDRILLCVLSTIDQLQERDAARSRLHELSVPLTAMFFIGDENEGIRLYNGISNLVGIEANQSDDVIQSSFPDSPSAQNLKIVSVLQWVAELTECAVLPPYVIVTTVARVMGEEFEGRLMLLRGEIEPIRKRYAHFIVGPLRNNPLVEDDEYLYCDMYPRLTGYDWTLADDEVRIFPPLTAKILFEASQRTLWTSWSKCDVTALSAAMAGVPFIRMWAFWPYYVEDELT